MNPLDKVLRELIAERGPLPFATFMEVALYHPDHGYYSKPASQTGFAGDFVTSGELGPEFGMLWATGLEALWHAAGSPSPFDLVEIGPGEGGFAEGVLRAAGGPFGDALRLHLVERSAARADRQKERLSDQRVEWHDSIDGRSFRAGCVVANEVLDNLPVHLVERRGEDILEVFVDARPGSFQEVLLPCSQDVAARAGRLDLADGARAEIALAAEDFTRECVRSVERGALVLIDYGLTHEERRDRPDGTLLAYGAAGVDDSVLKDPGERDITAHADWTTVANVLANEGAEVHGPFTQRDVLRSLGSPTTDDALKTSYREALAAGHGAGALHSLSRRGVLATLTDPAGLGRLQVVVGLTGIPAPQWLRGCGGE